ncbi:MAG: DNA-binding protein [Cellvibrionaceae bacterium]|nr:DNA-binding protein [Cellvibrionaceae bacterium]|tara:strand:- start:8344 stop:9234 length:891 start_codon:yes stop_codon:yes gene_type:complete
MPFLKKSLLAASLIAAVVFINHYFDIDDKLLYAYQEKSVPESVQRASVWLPDYVVDRDAVALKGVNYNLSGITYNPDSDSLWVIINQPAKLIELDQELQPKRTITLENFQDTEAVAYAGNNRFVIADERIQSLVIATINDSTQSLNKDDLAQLTLNTEGEDNKGLEGVAINLEEQSIYAVRERDPMAFLEVHGLLTQSNNIRVDKKPGSPLNKLYWTDLSGLHFDADSGNVLLLSHEAKLLSTLTLDGEKISHMDLEKGFNGLQADIPQAEGVTLDGQKNLYIVSEPNLIYRFKRR